VNRPQRTFTLTGHRSGQLIRRGKKERKPNSILVGVGLAGLEGYRSSGGGGKVQVIKARMTGGKRKQSPLFLAEETGREKPNCEMVVCRPLILGENRTARSGRSNLNKQKRRGRKDGMLGFETSGAGRDARIIDRAAVEKEGYMEKLSRLKVC